MHHRDNNLFTVIVVLSKSKGNPETEPVLVSAESFTVKIKQISNMLFVDI